jgi:hypothetical protein
VASGSSLSLLLLLLLGGGQKAGWAGEPGFGARNSRQPLQCTMAPWHSPLLLLLLLLWQQRPRSAPFNLASQQLMLWALAPLYLRCCCCCCCLAARWQVGQASWFWCKEQQPAPAANHGPHASTAAAAGAAEAAAIARWPVSSLCCCSWALSVSAAAAAVAAAWRPNGRLGGGPGSSARNSRTPLQQTIAPLL